MSRLVPTPIVDKNGKTTTVHKRASSSPSTGKLKGIAPTIGGAKPEVFNANVFKPNLAQLKAESRGYEVFAQRIDPGLYPLLVHGDQTRSLNIKASDVELYEALAMIKDTTNAIACLSANGGVPTADFLEEHGIGHLANTDPARSAIIMGALERRIPAYDFATFDRKFFAYSDMPAYLDAAHAYSMATLRKIPDFVHEVRRGDILLSDVMDVGVKAVGALKRSAGDEKTINMLRALKNGKANYTTADLKAVFSGWNTTQSNGLVAIELMDKYGGEFVSGLKDLNLARDIIFLCQEDGVMDYSPAIKYADDFRREQFRNHKQVYQLFSAGVDLDFALKHSRKVDEFSVQQVIALHEGISAPITDGWL